MSTHHVTSRRSRRRTYVAAALAVVGVAAAGGTSAHAQGDEGGDEFIAAYADAVFIKRDTTLHLAPGALADQGDVSEVLVATLEQESCQGRFLVTVDLATSLAAPDIDGVEVDALGGWALVDGTFPLEGTVTLTPAGRGCAAPLADAAVVSPLTTDVTVTATWANLRGSRPVVYSGADCGGDGVCYYRDASAKASWANDFVGDASARSTSAFLFEGTYSASSAALAVVPSLA